MELLTKQELAGKLKISVVTLNRLLSDGMPKIIVRGSVRFDYKETVKWFKKQREDNNA